MEEAGNAELGIRTKHEGIDEVVIDAPVHDVHASQSVCGAHVHESVVHQQIAALHQLHPHFPGQKHVLIKGRVVDAGREQNDARVADPRWRKLGQRLPEELTVVLDSLHRVAAKQVVQTGLDRTPVGEHVGNAGGHPQIVLEHHESVVRAHQVGPAHRYVGPVRHLDAAHLDAVLRTATHEIDGHHSVTENSCGTVNVGKKPVESFQTLTQSPIEKRPFARTEDSGQEIDGNDPFVRPLFPVDREGDPFVQE